jgi:hypothetical protein
VCTLIKISYYRYHDSDTDTGVSMETNMEEGDDDDKTFRYQTVPTPDSKFYE